MLAATIVLALLAAGMAAATAYLVRWASEARTPLRASTVLFLLLMMVAMVVGSAVYYADPGPASLVDGFWVASALMSVSVLQVFLGFLVEVRHRGTEGALPPPPLRHVRTFVASILLLVLANEFLMGWTFQSAIGAPISIGLGSAGALFAGLAAVVASPWFLFTMAAEMFLTAYFLRHRLPRAVSFVLVSQSGIMLLSPPALASPVWVALSVSLASAVMIALFVFLMEYLYRSKELARGFSIYLVRLLWVYGFMMAGLYFWLVYGDGLAFAAAVVLEMVLYFELVVRPERIRPEDRLAWQTRPNWAFQLLAGIFVAELFMGALLDAQLFGSVFTDALPALALSGSAATVVYHAVYNGFWFVALTTGSTWFLVMMGFEMGTLVAFKFRETRSRETRVRLGLMMGSYAAFAVFFPSLYYSMVFPRLAAGTHVPVLGWSMGIGSAPLAVGVFGVVLATYGITGGLSLLFGRRAICSTFCTAPLMFQGTAIDSMKSFNRSSPLARKYLSSRFSRAYSATMTVALLSLALASVASYLDTTGAVNVTILGADPTVFLFALYFGVLWYVLFVTIPYAGNYNCVTMGWCYTGAISQAFSRIGFFRLKVRDKEVCRRCTTVDCARSCPVGLVDMPGHFRQKGEFRSSKCCGVGDCVEACPYGNMYFWDVRHWLRAKLRRPEEPAPVRLPMVPATSSVSAPAPDRSSAGPSRPATVPSPRP